MPPPWEIIEDPEFSVWFSGLDDASQDAILMTLTVLEQQGPALGRPLVDTLKGSPLPNLKELRVQHQGNPWRILFAFDQKRRAILLVGGNKGPLGNRWYTANIPIAVRRARRHGIK